ncbi:hypothetical protein [Lactiplantibacillus plantarum]|uniref:hypothetical protein n=1 Tax=Lactiplantibacillus plantarum TaxID=1590 RepID=UPI000976A64F|nr:hypothetical protein [Lactiplantibacillus plantarum]MCK8475373.1 hypothetical protein [Lactiplantibacillus plantarum]
MNVGLGLTAAGKGVKAGVKGISMAREGMKGSYQKMVDGLTGEASALPDPTKATQAKDQQQTNPTTGQPTMDRSDQGDQPKSNRQPTNEETETSAEADPSSEAAPDGTKTATGDGAGKEVPPMPDPTVKADQEPDKDSDEKLPDPTAGVTTDKNINQKPAKAIGINANGNLPDPATAKETEASLEETIPNPTAVGAEVSSADRPEDLAREDGVSEPMSQPSHGDQANKGVITKGVISDYEEDEREVFERPVDEQPEWPVDRQPGSVNDDRTTTQPQSSHEVKPVSGRQPVMASGPKRSAGKTLTKAGTVLTTVAREQDGDKQSMVNLPEIKIDDSIY